MADRLRTPDQERARTLTICHYCCELRMCEDLPIEIVYPDGILTDRAWVCDACSDKPGRCI